MKSSFENTTLIIAIAVSVMVHAALILFVRFVDPESFKLKASDPGLEVILVNAKHDKKPANSDLLAQANLDGGGTANEGRAKSPLPNLQKVEEGDSIQAATRRAAELEALQQKMMTQVAKTTKFSAPQLNNKEKPKELPIVPEGIDAMDSRKVAMSEAEIAKNIENYNKRPKKTQITPSTRQIEYAMYYKSMQSKIERWGTFNFPHQKGKKLYGELTVYIPVLHDGSLYEKEGGPRVERSSGNQALDKAAIDIVRRAAPFGRFPANMRSTGKDDVWEIVTSFKFTRDDELDLRGAGN